MEPTKGHGIQGRDEVLLAYISCHSCHRYSVLSQSCYSPGTKRDTRTPGGRRVRCMRPAALGSAALPSSPRPLFRRKVPIYAPPLPRSRVPADLLRNCQKPMPVHPAFQGDIAFILKVRGITVIIFLWLFLAYTRVSSGKERAGVLSWPPTGKQDSKLVSPVPDS